MKESLARPKTTETCSTGCFTITEGEKEDEEEELVRDNHLKIESEDEEDANESDSDTDTDDEEVADEEMSDGLNNQKKKSLFSPGGKRKNFEGWRWNLWLHRERVFPDGLCGK